MIDRCGEKCALHFFHHNSVEVVLTHNGSAPPLFRGGANTCIYNGGAPPLFRGGANAYFGFVCVEILDVKLCLLCSFNLGRTGTV